MKPTLICCLALISLVGCTPAPDFMDSLFGIKHNAVVLASNAFELSQTPVRFASPTEAKVAGKISNVCVVLAGGIPLKDSEKEGDGLLKGTKIMAIVTTSSGASRKFGRQGIGWAMSGRVVPTNEITACVQPCCAKQALPVGSTIRSISISSTAPVHVLGAYWYSTAAFDQVGN